MGHQSPEGQNHVHTPDQADQPKVDIHRFSAADILVSARPALVLLATMGVFFGGSEYESRTKIDNFMATHPVVRTLPPIEGNQVREYLSTFQYQNIPHEQLVDARDKAQRDLTISLGAMVGSLLALLASFRLREKPSTEPPIRYI